jgi:hypothetical protein
MEHLKDDNVGYSVDINEKNSGQKLVHLVDSMMAGMPSNRVETAKATAVGVVAAMRSISQGQG